MKPRTPFIAPVLAVRKTAIASASYILLFGALSLPAFAGPVTSYPNFSNTTGLTINGNAATANTSDGTVLRLTPATSFQAGSAFSSAQVGLGSFSTFFQFRFSSGGGILGPADGIVFVIQPSGASQTSVGQNGGFLGYEPAFNPSVAVEFDTLQNSWETDSNHVAILENGNAHNDLSSAIVGGVANCASFAPSPGSGCLSNGDLWSVWIDYDGTTLQVRLADGSTVRPTNALLSRMENIPCVLGGGLDSGACSVTPQTSALFGFTSATGGGFQNHDIVDWQFSSTSGPPTAAPEPSTWMLLSAGLIAAGCSRRRKPS